MSIGRDDSPGKALLPEQEQVSSNGPANEELVTRVWIETKKLWRIVGPAIVNRLASYSMNIITVAFAGHLGDVQLAAISIANTVIVGFSLGLLLGMATALETVCGQAFGARKYQMLGIYLQRSWIILFLCCILLLPFYIWTAPILKWFGQPDDVADASEVAALWFIPLPFSFALMFPLQRFLQSQLKNQILLWIALAGLVVNVFTSWLFVYVLHFGVAGAAVALSIASWVMAFGLLGYATCGWCPLTWNGLSMQAFSRLWEFVKLSAASGVMLCLENWYYRILLLMTGFLTNATIAVDALSVCLSINGWEFMIPIAFLAATGVRVANELGAGDGKAAKFATQISVVQSFIIGLFFCVLIMILRDKIALIFTTSTDVLEEVDKLSLLLAVTILLNGVQPVLSGVAVGSGWQSKVAYINLACYYLVGLPLGLVIGWVLKLGVQGIWGGMVFGGTAIQTLILGIIVIKCNWVKEAESAQARMQKLLEPKPGDEPEIQHD